jgi:signal transduction histidine kinase
MCSMNRNRPPAKLWQTTTFRMAIVFAAVFGLGTALLLVVLDIAVGRFAEETAQDALRDQVAVLAADANAEGGAALIASLREHVSGGQPERFSYLVITPSGERLSAGLPDSVQSIRGEGSIRLPMAAEEDETVDSQSIEVIVLTDRATDGTFIAVGRDTYALEELRQWLHRLAIVGGMAIVLLALIGGAAAGAVLLRRLKGVTEAAGRVMSGDLSERLPSLGIGREFDDLSDTLNAMLERLESAMEAIRQVSADVAHDLRTPLTRLRNRLEDAQAAPPDARDELLGDAVGETDRLLEIFAALLRLAQIEGGTSRHFAVFDLVPTMSEVVEAYQPAADEAGWRLRFASDPEAMVEGDSALLAQAVASLIDNALTHGAPGKTITVTVRRQADGATITVEDDGPGAPEAELVNLTRRFYRLDRSRHTVGSGLGLSMVSAIATLHGAPVRIVNRNPGLAVTLTVRAPLNPILPSA